MNNFEKLEEAVKAAREAIDAADGADKKGRRACEAVLNAKIVAHPPYQGAEVHVLTQDARTRLVRQRDDMALATEIAVREEAVVDAIGRLEQARHAIQAVAVLAVIELGGRMGALRRTQK